MNRASISFSFPPKILIHHSADFPEDIIIKFKSAESALRNNLAVKEEAITNPFRAQSCRSSVYRTRLLCWLSSHLG